MNLWPFIPTGNFFNNWLSVMYFSNWVYTLQQRKILMNNFANTIRYIFRLIKETPKTLNIIAECFKWFLVFIGLPMLLPALNLMEGIS